MNTPKLFLASRLEIIGQVDKTLFRNTMGRFATGITVVSTQSSGILYGFTVNSFTSVSLDPPLVLFCVKNESSFIDLLRETQSFAVSFLSAGQETVSNVFANPNIESQDRFSQIESVRSPLNNPLIKDSLAWVDCSLEDVHIAGDHHICVGHVRHISDIEHSNGPLLYYGGSYAELKES